MKILPIKILAHNILSAHIGRESSGVPIFDTSALINTKSYYSLESILSGAYSVASNSPIAAREFSFYLTELKEEINTLLSACEDVAYSPLPLSPSRFAVQYAAGFGIVEQRYWLASSPYRLLAFIPPGTVASIPEIINFLAQEEAGLFYRLLTEITIDPDIRLLNEAVFHDKVNNYVTL